MSFVTTLVHNQQDYWILNHKITVDDINKYIIVNSGVTELNVKIDLYSDIKEWFKLRDNSKLTYFPIRSIGGDDTVLGQTAGDIYFMQNGYRVVYDPTKVTVVGALFSDDYDTPWLYSETLEPIYASLVSSLVSGVNLSTLATPSDIPTAEQNAAANWNALRTEFKDPGSFGEFIQRLLTTAKFLGLK